MTNNKKKIMTNPFIMRTFLDRIFYGNDRKDAAAIGFDDDFIYQEIPLKPEQRHKTMQRLMGMEALRAFRMWEERADKTEY